MLRRAYTADAALPAAVDDACLLAVTKTYFREREALLRCTAQLVTLAASQDSAAGPAHDALQQLLHKVRLGCAFSDTACTLSHTALTLWSSPGPCRPRGPAAV
jgi:hypothetical protein